MNVISVQAKVLANQQWETAYVSEFYREGEDNETCVYKLRFTRKLSDALLFTESEREAVNHIIWLVKNEYNDCAKSAKPALVGRCILAA